jgi:hypothetical protein
MVMAAEDTERVPAVNAFVPARCPVGAKPEKSGLHFSSSCL